MPGCGSRSFYKTVSTPDQQGKAGKNGKRGDQHISDSRIVDAVFDGMQGNGTITQNYLCRWLPSGPLKARQRCRGCHEQATEYAVHLPLPANRGHEPEQLACEQSVAHHYQNIDQDECCPHGGELLSMGCPGDQKCEPHSECHCLRSQNSGKCYNTRR